MALSVTTDITEISTVVGAVETVTATHGEAVTLYEGGSEEKPILLSDWSGGTVVDGNLYPGAGTSMRHLLTPGTGKRSIRVLSKGVFSQSGRTTCSHSIGANGQTTGAEFYLYALNSGSSTKIVVYQKTGGVSDVQMWDSGYLAELGTTGIELDINIVMNGNEWDVTIIVSKGAFSASTSYTVTVDATGGYFNIRSNNTNGNADFHIDYIKYVADSGLPDPYTLEVPGTALSWEQDTGAGYVEIDTGNPLVKTMVAGDDSSTIRAVANIVAGTIAQYGTVDSFTNFDWMPIGTYTISATDVILFENSSGSQIASSIVDDKIHIKYNTVGGTSLEWDIYDDTDTFVHTAFSDFGYSGSGFDVSVEVRVSPTTFFSDTVPGERIDTAFDAEVVASITANGILFEFIAGTYYSSYELVNASYSKMKIRPRVVSQFSPHMIINEIIQYSSTGLANPVYETAYSAPISVSVASGVVLDHTREIATGDPKMFLTADGMTLRFENGVPVMEQGLENVAHISLGCSSFSLNAVATSSAEKIESRFISESKKSITVNQIKIIESAAEEAFQWTVEEGLIKSVAAKMIFLSNIGHILRIVITPPTGEDRILQYGRNGENWYLQKERSDGGNS